MFIRKLLPYCLIFVLLACAEKSSRLAPQWEGANQAFTEAPLQKEKHLSKAPGPFEAGPQVSDETLRVIAENLFTLQENSSEKLKVSEGLTFGATLLYYLGTLGEYTLNSYQIEKLLSGFEKLLDNPIDEKITKVLHQIKTLKFTVINGKNTIEVRAKEEQGIVYHINEVNEDNNSDLDEIKYVKAINGATIQLEQVLTKLQKDELYKFVTKTGKRDAIHREIPININDYFAQEEASPIIKLKFNGITVKVKTRTIWKNIKFKFKYAWAIPLFHVNNQKIPGFVIFIKKNFAKVKISIDQ